MGDLSYIALAGSERQPQGAERERELRWRLQLRSRQLRERLGFGQRPALLLLLICFSSAL